jgi:hypothetical protein
LEKIYSHSNIVLATKSRQELEIGLLTSIKMKMIENKLSLYQTKFFGFVEKTICNFDVRRKVTLRLIAFSEVAEFVSDENYKHIIVAQKIGVAGKETKSCYDLHKESDPTGGDTCLQIEDDANGLLLYYPDTSGGDIAKKVFESLDPILNV